MGSTSFKENKWYHQAMAMPNIELVEFMEGEIQKRKEDAGLRQVYRSVPGICATWRADEGEKTLNYNQKGCLAMEYAEMHMKKEL